MKMSLRARMMLAALLPVALVSVSLSVLFLVRHLTDIDQALERSGQALARQTASAMEFSLISGNRELSQAIGLGVLRTEPDVRGLAVVDAESKPLVMLGALNREIWPAIGGTESRVSVGDVDVFIVPVEQHTLAVDDVYSGTEIAVARRPKAPLGHVVVEIARDRVAAERNRLMSIALLTGLGGLILGGGLAISIARGVTQPLLDATDVVGRIGRGDLAARMRERTAGPLRSLAAGINAMAVRIGLTQEQLQTQIDSSIKELVRQRDSAERATKAKTRFLASASHDLRQPLHALGLFVAQLARMDWTDKRQEIFRNMEVSVTSLQEMLGALLDLSKLDADGYRPDVKPFALGVLLQRVAREMDPVAAERGLALRTRVRDDWVLSDPALIERLARNLLANALRYTDEGGILLAVRRVGAAARIQVWDTGIGIENDLREEIFEEYVQAGNEERDQGKGLGLGLAICRRIAHLLGSEIRVRSELGRGSVFSIDVPLTEADSPPAEDEDVRESRLDIAVLLVDNDGANRSASAVLLASWGATVIEASDIDSALETCRKVEVRPKVAICDLGADGSPGEGSVVRRFRDRCPDTKIILISAGFSATTQAIARKYGFPLLRKPVAPARLRATLLTLAA